MWVAFSGKFYPIGMAVLAWQNTSVTDVSCVYAVIDFSKHEKVSTRALTATGSIVVIHFQKPKVIAQAIANASFDTP